MDEGRIVDKWERGVEPDEPITIELNKDSIFVNEFVNKIKKIKLDN